MCAVRCADLQGSLRVIQEGKTRDDLGKFYGSGDTGGVWGMMVLCIHIDDRHDEI